MGEEVDNDEEDVVEVPKKPRLKGPINEYAVVGLSLPENREGNLKQQTLKNSISKERRDRVNDYLAFWAYKCSIPFNALTDPAFVAFCEQLGRYGQVSWVLVSSELLMALLILIVQGLYFNLLRSLMNLYVNSELGTCFLRVVNGSADTHSAEFILQF